MVEKRVTSTLLVSASTSQLVTSFDKYCVTDTQVCICCKEPSSIQKIAEIDQHIGVAMSGLTADAKTLIDRARVETQVKLANV